MTAYLKKLSRNLRNNPTEAEKLLWSKLKNKQVENIKFRRQQPVDSYIVDFLSFEHRLIVEIDGGQHCNSSKDIERTKILESHGFLVLRFWNNEIFENLNGVIETIINTLNPHLYPPPQGEEKSSHGS